MTKDRLADFKAVLQNDDADLDDFFVVIQSRDGSMDKIFVEIAEIRRMIDQMQVNVEQVKQMYDKILSSPKVNEKSKEKLSQLTTEVTSSANIIRSCLKIMEEKTEKRNDPPTSLKRRIRETQHFSLTRSFVQLISQYNEMQVDYKQRCKDKLQRQLEITGCPIGESDFQEIMEKENFAVFTRGIVSEPLMEQKQRLADIQARHADILKLEKSILELHDLFLDMSLLVQHQGELMDRIETHVNRALENVVIGVDKIDTVESWKRKWRIRNVICISLVIFIVIIIIGCSLVF